MKQLLRHGVERLPAPLPVLLQDWFRHLRYGQVRRRRQAHGRILGRLESPGVVAQGPFRRMRYLSSAFCSEVLPKLVGTYESEASPAIEAICDAGCDRIIDIGAAEGYYAVGLALRNPGARVIGFEMNPSARYYLRRLARRNGVADRIEVRGTCDPDSLARAMAGAVRPAVVCDCEGAEDFLLRPDRIEPLRRALVLVETHDGLTTDAGVLEGITDRLRDRFGPTHEVEVIASRDRRSDDLPAGNHLSPEEAAEAMDEGRPWAQWLFLTPKASPHDRGIRDDTWN
jgi:hypothetical protein